MKYIYDVNEAVLNYELNYYSMPVGHKDINKIINNLSNYGVITLLGEPAMGKSMLAINMVNNLLTKNNACLYFSDEIRSNIVIERLVALNSELSLNSVANNKFNKEENKEYKATLSTIAGLNLSFADYIPDTKDELEEIIKEYLGDSNLNGNFCIVLDEVKNNELYVGISKLAKKYHILFIVLSTYKSDDHNNTRIVNYMNYYDVIEDNAIRFSDKLFFLYRDTYFNYNSDNKLLEIYDLRCNVKYLYEINQSNLFLEDKGNEIY